MMHTWPCSKKGSKRSRYNAKLRFTEFNIYLKLNLDNHLDNGSCLYSKNGHEQRQVHGVSLTSSNNLIKKTIIQLFFCVKHTLVKRTCEKENT